ncbi:MAG: Manganese ABC transporter, ATP-binding protein SitB, partial [uncultured Solirubrobacteraceae bacterium]
ECGSGRHAGPRRPAAHRLLRVAAGAVGRRRDIPGRRHVGRRGAQRRRQVDVAQSRPGLDPDRRGTGAGARPPRPRQPQAGRLCAAARRGRLGLPDHRRRGGRDGSLRAHGVGAPRPACGPGARRRVPGARRDGLLRRPADRTALRRAAPARLHRPRTGPAGGGHGHGRAVRRRRCAHRSRHPRAARGPARRGPVGHRRPSRPADGADGVRLGAAAQRPRRRRRPRLGGPDSGHPAAGLWRGCRRPRGPAGGEMGGL